MRAQSLCLRVGALVFLEGAFFFLLDKFKNKSYICNKNNMTLYETIQHQLTQGHKVEVTLEAVDEFNKNFKADYMPPLFPPYTAKQVYEYKLKKFCIYFNCDVIEQKPYSVVVKPL